MGLRRYFERTMGIMSENEHSEGASARPRREGQSYEGSSRPSRGGYGQRDSGGQRDGGKGDGGKGDRRPRDRRGGRRRFGRGKVCAMCVEKAKYLDYKDVRRLQRYVSERGKINPRRASGACSTHQRVIKLAIHRARMIALLPYKA